ncbi:S6e family ribosomal protein [Nanoarchaeota archaeon]
MAEFKLVLNAKDGKSYQKQVTGKEAEALLGKNIGEKVSGDTMGFAGYEFEVTGGSDSAGFPMRKGLSGFGRKRIFTKKGVGFKGRDRWKKSQPALRVKKTVCCEKIYPKITQVNLKVLKEGTASLGEAPKEEAPAEAPKEVPKETPKEEPKEKDKPKEEKPAEEKKEETKAEEKK